MFEPSFFRVALKLLAWRGTSRSRNRQRAGADLSGGHSRQPGENRSGHGKRPWPAVVVQTNPVAVVISLAPVPVVIVEVPLISTASDAMPPVHLRVNPALSVTVVGKGLLRASGGPMVIEVLNGPTSLPPEPVTLYVPARIEPLGWPGKEVPSVNW